MDSDRGRHVAFEEWQCSVRGTRVATCVRGWGGDIKLSKYGVLLLQVISSSIGDGMNLESGVFFSDEGMTNSICDMMPSSGVSVPCESGC